MANKDDIKNQEDLNTAKTETNRLSAEENRFLELGRKIAAETTEETRNLGQELRDMLGLSKQRNDYDKALLGLSRDITSQAQKNAVELGRNGEIAKEILKDEKILEAAKREQLISSKGLNSVQITGADKISKAQTKRQEVISEIDELYDQLATADDESAKKLKEDIAKKEDQLAAVESTLDTHLKVADADTQRLALSNQLVDKAQKNLDVKSEEGNIQKQINDRLGVTGGLIKAAGGLMSKLGVSGTSVSDGIKEAEKAMTDFADKAVRSGESVSRLQVAMKGVGPFVKTLAKGFTDPAVLLGSILDNYLKVDKAASKFQQLTGQNADNIAGMNSEMASSVSVLTTATELTEQMGVNALVAFGPEIIAGAAALKNELGLSAENVGVLALNAKLSNTNMAGLEAQVQAATEEFNNTNDAAVSSTQVVRDMGKASKAVQAQFAGYPGKLASAAAAARKIGMELKDIEGISDSLLDFQSSIEAEMEAELLTGKQLNLNKARELALANDLEGVSKELFKNSVDVSEYAKMGRIEQEAMAKAMGMTREQLGEMAIQRSINANMTDEEKAKIRGVTLEESKRMDVQAKIQESLDKLAQSFAPLLTIVADLADILGVVVKPIAHAIAMVTGLINKFAILKVIAGAFVALWAANKIAGALGAATTALKLNTAVQTVANSAKTTSVAITNSSIVSSIREKVATLASTAAQKAASAATYLWNGVKSASIAVMNSSIVTWIREKVAIIGSTIAQKLSMATTKASTALTYLWNVVKGASISLMNSSILTTGKERLATIASTVAQRISMAAQGAWNIMKSAGIAVMNLSGMAWLREKAAMVGSTVAQNASAAATAAWNGVKTVSNMLMATGAGRWVAEKIAIIGSTIAKWANIGATSAAAAANTALATSQTAVGTTGAAASGGLVAAGTALGAFGVAAAPAIPVILAIGAALLMASPAIWVLGEVIKTIAEVIGNVLMKALEMLPSIITSVANGFTQILGAVTPEAIAGLFMLGPALISAAFGFTAFSIAIAAGALAGGLASIMGGGLLPQIIMLGTLAEPLSTVASSLTSIASAIATISENLANLDTSKLEALSNLVLTTAIAAPMIGIAAGALGDMVAGVAGGGEEGSAKAENNEKLIAKIEELIAVTKQGKNINMDSRRVNNSLQQSATNT